MQLCEPCEPEEAEPPAKRFRGAGLGAKGVPDSWATTPSVPWPGYGKPKFEGVRYHIDKDGERTYWLFRNNIRYLVCVCKDQGLCGLRAESTATRPGYANGCALREDREKACDEARDEDGALPAWKGKKAHKGHEHFVLHKGRECVTKPSTGQAVPLCACGACFRACQNLQHEYALGCVHNDAPKCATTGCLKVAVVQGYCSRCATLTDGPGATKLMRRKVQPPSSLLETFLLVQSGTSSTFGQPEASS